ncbi:hypothetical protein BJX99DRAFT_264498 [Aspergillus californicus]
MKDHQKHSMCWFYRSLARQLGDIRADLAITVLAKKVEKRALTRRTGHELKENDPDDDQVPRYYNLLLASKKKVLREWTLRSDTSATAGFVQQINSDWKLLSETVPPTTLEEVQIRLRVDTVIMKAISFARDAKSTTSTTKKSNKNKNKRQGETPIHILADKTKQPAIDLILYTSKRTITMDDDENNKKDTRGGPLHLTSKVDGVLWSGEQENLDATLLVLRAPKEGAVWTWSLLKSLAMIHNARQKAGLDAEIYGIATDSHTWAFIRINNKGQYSKWVLDWEYDEKEIVTHILRILEYAAARAGRAARAMPGIRSVSEMTGCRITHPKFSEDGIGVRDGMRWNQGHRPSSFSHRLLRFNGDALD